MRAPTVHSLVRYCTAARLHSRIIYDGGNKASFIFPWGDGGGGVVPMLCRNYASAQPSGKEQKSLTERGEDGGAITLSLGEKVKENAKTGGYGIVIIAGIGVTGGLLYVILSELFSSESPNNIYTHASKLCKLSPEVQDALGTPIKCYGEETRRGWRRHVSHVEFFQGNTKILRMKFYIEGPFGKATVNVEKKKNESGKYEFSYLFVDVNYPPRRINVNF